MPTPPGGHEAIQEGRSMSERLEPGDPAPGSTLPTPDGDEVSLETLRGGKAVLYSHPAAMTSGCTTRGATWGGPHR